MSRVSAGVLMARKPAPLQRRAASQAAPPQTVPPSVYETLRSSGQPLDSDVRATMEALFGHDFSRVRVHRDAKAAESAQAVNALAYTVGRNIAFAAGQFEPSSAQGKHLLAHELAHVVQQGAAGVLPGKGANPECFGPFPGSCPPLPCWAGAARLPAPARLTP
jgi:hypothetical protein